MGKIRRPSWWARFALPTLVCRRKQTYGENQKGGLQALEQMEVGPPKSVFRDWLQITSSGCY